MEARTVERTTLTVSALLKAGVAALLFAAVLAEPIPVSDAPLQQAPVAVQR